MKQRINASFKIKMGFGFAPDFGARDSRKLTNYNFFSLIV
jgi:hypothetical protein